MTKDKNMKDIQLPKEMIKARSKSWLNAKLPELLEQIPPRHRKVVQIPFKVPFQYPLQSTYLSGKVRTGKTVKAWQITLEWHKQQFIRRLSRDFIFVSITELLSEFRNSYSSSETTEAKILEKYKKVKLLILDDFGAEKTTEWAYQMLYIVLSYRYDYEKTTIYTSNFSLKELPKRLGDDRITSRIAHECKGNISTFTNEPYL